MKIILSILFISFYISSCYSPRYVYSPPTQNIPGINKKNDVELAANYSTSIDISPSSGNYNHGFGLHTAWAVSNHFALMLNENFRWEKSSTNDTFFQGDSSFLNYKSNFTEVGAGYYSSIKNNDKMQFQFFAGVAFGSSKISDDYFSNNVFTKKYHKNRVTKLYIQPAVIFKPGNNFNAAFSSRLTEILFSHINTNYTSAELNNYLLDSITNSSIFFWEPALTYTFGFKKFPARIRIQGSVSILLNHRFVEHRSSNIGIAVVSGFRSRQQKIKPEVKKELSVLFDSL
ncbi:MAG: hypothetical protein ABIO76_03825 [Ginsengibacter sp.]